MSVAFKKGQPLTEQDLIIAVRDSAGALFDPSVISYSLFDYTSGVEALIGVPNRQPASTATGIFYVPGVIPLDANIGEWVVRWNMRQYADSPITQVAQRFQVVGDQIVTEVTKVNTEKVLIGRLRTLLRDNNPDRNYRFRPPNTEKFLQSQTEVMGFLWEVEELYEYLLMSVDTFNSAPPVTGIVVGDMPDRWRTVVLMGAAAHACRAMAMNWAADEFSYSISGVSLDIDKSSKYLSLKENFEGQHEKMLDQAKSSIKIVKGLQQPRYGIGISSALGPYSRVGVQSRRNYISGGGSWV